MNTRKNKASLTAWPPQSVLIPGPNHKWRREVVFDFHEVCVKWVHRFADFIHRQYGIKIDPETIQFTNLQYDPSNGLTPEQFNEAFVTFARLSKGGYGDLEAHAGIKETMEQIRAAGIGISIWTWTPGAIEQKFEGGSAYQTGVAQRVTRDLIQKLGLPIDVDRELRFMQPGGKMWAMAEEHIPLIVEDNPATAVQVAGLAHAAILVPEAYNESLSFNNVLRLNDRSELAPAVIEFFKKLDEAGVLL